MTRTRDPYDELASMFLTETEEAPSAPAVRRTMRELLVVGHLPVRAGLWLAPYADALARERGSCGVIRLDGEAPHLTVLRGGRELPHVRRGSALRDAIESLAGHIDCWIVRSPRNAEFDELVLAGADRITILSSADGAAVCAAYRIIKDLADAVEATAEPLPSIGIAFMGVDEISAEDALRRINRTTAAHIGVEVPMVLCLPRMDAVPQTAVDLPCGDEHVPRPGDVLSWVEAAERRELHPASNGRPAVAAEPSPRNGTPLRLEEDEPEEPDDDGPIDEAVATTSARRTIRLAPKPGLLVEPKKADQVTEPAAGGRPLDLAEHIPGLTPIPPRCPTREHVEIAVDASGLLHVLARETALRDLWAVAAWARAHLELIAMACREHRFDRGGAPVCHLFTDRPTAVADLHGSDLHLHVLAPVEVEGRRGWYTAALNCPGVATTGLAAVD